MLWVAFTAAFLPSLTASAPSALRPASAAAASRRPISFFRRRFFWSSNSSCLLRFSCHVEKHPLWSSTVVRFRASTWSTQPSRNTRSWETRINPFFPFRYRLTASLASMSRWLVGSSMSRKPFSLANSRPKVPWSAPRRRGWRRGGTGSPPPVPARRTPASPATAHSPAGPCTADPPCPGPDPAPDTGNTQTPRRRKSAPDIRTPP